MLEKTDMNGKSPEVIEDADPGNIDPNPAPNPDPGLGDPGAGDGQPDPGQPGSGDDQAGEGGDIVQDPEPAGPTLQEALARIEELESKIKAGDEGDPEPKAPEPARPPTDAEWPEIEKEWGFTYSKDETTGERIVSVEGRKLINAVVGRMQNVYGKLLDEMDKRIHGSTNTIRFDSIVSGLEKSKYPDIRQYSDAIQKYLKRYSPAAQSKEEYIVDGYRWARGGNMKNIVKNMQKNKDGKMRIVQPASRNAAPAMPRGNGRLTPQTMSEEQKEIAKKTYRDMAPDKAYAEYCRMF